MKFSIERAALLKAVAQAQSVVERRNTIPILANVLIEANGDDVMFRATDLDIEVVDKAPAKVERAGATTVSAVTLNEIVRKLPDGALVTLTEDGTSGRLTIEAGRSNFSLATLPKEDFPVMATSEYDANFSAPAPTLRRLFDKSKFAISTEETRYYLNGVYMHVSEADGGKVLRNTRKLEVDAAEFAKAVDRVATVSSERSRAVKLALDEDRLILSVNAPDSGAAEEELAVAYGDERLEIGFNAKYLLEIASQVDRENAVFMFNASGDPTLMREGNDTTAIYVVMPMRV